jgi:hypothetical protein
MAADDWAAKSTLKNRGLRDVAAKRQNGNATAGQDCGENSEASAQKEVGRNM